jgi:LacI family transcriptional regulator
MARRRGKAITMADVAATAGVSVMTVSNVVNRRLHLMSASTRERIEATIRTLNYRPHAVAQNLRRAERLLVGLLIVYVPAESKAL